MHYPQYEFDTPLSVVGDEPRTHSEAGAHVGVGFDDFELGVTVPQLSVIPGEMSVIPGFEAMFDADEDQWQDRALCAQTDPEAFFPEKGGSTREAKRICMGCEVRGECLEYALANDERFGIWGGLSERERRRLKRGII